MTVRSRLAGSGAAATSHAVTLPTGVVTGDRLIVGFVNDDTTADPSVASGWTQVGTTQDQGTTTNHSLSVWTRVATGSDSLTVSLTASQEAEWVAICLEGDGGTPQFAFANGGNATTGAVTAITGLASGDYDSIIFLGLDNGGAVAQTVTPPAAWASLTHSFTSTDAIGCWSMDQAGVGVTGFSPANVTWTNAEQWITGHIVVPKAAAGPVLGPVVRSVTSAGEANTPDVSVAKPAGLAVGDYLLAFQMSDADGTLAAMTAPSGFTQLGSQAPTQATNIPPGKVWGKVAVQADVDATTFAFPDSTGAHSTVVLVAIQTGTYDTTTPTSTPAWNTQGTSTDANVIAPSITGVVDALLMTGYMPDTGGVVRTFSSGPAGMTLTHQSAAGNSTYTRIGVYQQKLTAAGATGTKTTVLSGSPDGWAATALQINPAPSNTAIRTGGFLQLL